MTSVIYDGRKYSLASNGYFFATKKLNGQRLDDLHRQVFRDVFGDIPKGMHVHHLDHNKMNNSPCNLALVSASEHIKLHQQEIPEQVKACVVCHSSIVTKRGYRRVYCNTKCQARHRRLLGLDNVEKACPVCKNTFKSNKHKNQVCCSISCANKIRKRGTDAPVSL